MSEMWYTYWLACVEGITGDRKCELCRKNGSAERARFALTRMYITPAPTHGTSLSVKSADRQKHRRAAMKKQSGIFLQERA